MHSTTLKCAISSGGREVRLGRTAAKPPRAPHDTRCVEGGLLGCDACAYTQENPLAVKSLKHMLLCKIMTNASDEVPGLIDNKASKVGWCHLFALMTLTRTPTHTSLKVPFPPTVLRSIDCTHMRILTHA